MIHVRIALPLLLAALCGAQEAPRPAPVKKQAPIVTMSFAGGSMAAFVVAVRAAEPKANIVLQVDAAEAVVPALEIKEAGLDQILDCACAVAESTGQVGCVEQRGNGEPVYAIISRRRGPTTVGPVPVDPNTLVTTTVLSLNRLTDGYPEVELPGLQVETILSAIETGTSFDGKPPMMRYHQDSGLLFMHGSRTQLALANQVLEILEGDLMDRAQAAGQKRSQKAAKAAGAKDR